MRIAIFNQKGGVGKTATALNLAAAIARNDGAPLLLDLDPQCHITSIHGAPQNDPNRSLFGFYQGLRPLDELVVPWDGMGQLIPAHPQLIKVDTIYGKGPSILNKLRSGLDAFAETPVSKSSQNILIDCCPYMGVLALNAVFACDLLIIPISSDYLSLQAAGHMTRTLACLEPVLKRRVERRYLLTRYDRRRKMSEDIRNQLQQNYGDEVCQTVITENVSIAESPAKNRDVFRHAPSSRGAADYTSLYRELLEQGLLNTGSA